MLWTFEIVEIVLPYIVCVCVHALGAKYFVYFSIVVYVDRGNYDIYVRYFFSSLCIAFSPFALRNIAVRTVIAVLTMQRDYVLVVSATKLLHIYLKSKTK